MIEFLSNNSWISPQIDFLVFLQSLRISHFEMFNKLFLSLTIFGEYWLPTTVLGIIYWCFDSKAGTYLFSLYGLNYVFTQFFKMIACVYRPWILSDRIKPVKEAFMYAHGYSFPSGHSATASSVYGGIAYSYRKKFVPALLLIFLVLLVGFSRLWLGVHTPQDVVTGLTIGCFLIFAVNSLMNWMEENKNRYLYILGAINIIVTLLMVYICYFNVYPCVYIDGKLLVNPYSAIHTYIVCIGYALGLINGCFLIRRFLPFDPKKSGIKSRIIRGVIGCFLVYILSGTVLKYIFTHTIDFKLAFVLSFMSGFFITGIYPAIFTKLEKRS